MPVKPHDVAIAGSGCGGTILARILASRGLRVVLLERGGHPRFTIGESSTPLGNLALERIAHRYGLTDLWHLAQHGRWLEHAPELARGLKRGFTFYRHRPGERLAVDAENSARLLVAASPDDEVADTHWRRDAVDARLVERAVEEGVDYRPHTEVTGVRTADDRVTLHSPGGEAVVARYVVDASGVGGVVAEALGIPNGPNRLRTRSAFVGNHFEGLGLFIDHLAARGAPPPPGPYPDDWAAVHHWIDEGWVYALRFDDGRMSAGLLLEGGSAAGMGAPERDPAATFREVLSGYPDLAEYFAAGRPVEPWLSSGRLQRIRAQAAGPRWALLPHGFAFVDPLYSTGIAWTLRGVERLAEAILRAADTTDPAPSEADRSRYGDLLKREALQIDRLVAGAYAARGHFRLSVAHSMLYFAAVSWAETVERLEPEGAHAWSGFLGVGDPLLGSLPGDALGLLDVMEAEGGRAHPDEAAVARFERWVADAIELRNVAGLMDPAKRNLYPADPADLVRSAALVRLTPETMRARLPSLRGTPDPS